MEPSSVMATPLDMIQAHVTWLRTWCATTTTTNAEKLLHRLHRQLPAGLDAALPEELAEWLANPGWSRETRGRYYKDIVRFYRWATDGRDPWLSYNPATELRRPVARRGLPRPAPDASARTAVYDLPGKWLLVGRLAVLAGLRPCEIARLTRADVTAEVITVRGKGDKTRAVPTHPLIWELVEPMPAGPLVRGPKGRPADAEYVSKAGAYHLRRAGLDITLYRLRHYFGTTVQAEYRDARVVQELMGHASLTTTQGYMQVTSERMRAAVATLPFSAPGAGTPAGPTSAPHAPAGADSDLPASRVDAPPRQPRSAGAGRRVGGRVVRSRSRPPRH